MSHVLSPLLPRSAPGHPRCIKGAHESLVLSSRLAKKKKKVIEGVSVRNIGPLQLS